MGLVGELLERAARAWPVAQERWLDGWWLRSTDTDPWWSGAVLAHGARDRLEARIAAAERFYARRGDWPRFQVCPDCPPGLDSALAARGYLAECPVTLMTARAPVPPAPPGGLGFDVRVEPFADDTWLAVRAVTSDAAPDPTQLRRRLQAVTLPQAFVTVRDTDRPLGVGRAVADSGWTGVFDMATVAQARHRGVARAVLAGLTAWSLGRAGPHMFLQVEAPNAAAQALYRGSGYTVAADYHYRSRRPRQATLPAGRTDMPQQRADPGSE